MITVRAKYHANTLMDIAEKFEEDAKYHNKMAAHKTTTMSLREKRYHKGKAEGLEWAAMILRNTDLGPESVNGK